MIRLQAHPHGYATVQDRREHRGSERVAVQMRATLWLVALVLCVPQSKRHTRRWTVVPPLVCSSQAHATAEQLTDNSVRWTGKPVNKDVYCLEFVARRRDLGELRIEALLDGRRGPGRTPHGNFVLTGVELWLLPRRGPARRLVLESAHADHAQVGYPASAAIDGRASTGWAIQGAIPNWRRSHSLRVRVKERLRGGSGVRFRVVLRHEWGLEHSIRRVRISVRSDQYATRPASDEPPQTGQHP